MELNGWSSQQMLRCYGASAPQHAGPPHLRPHHDRPALTQPASTGPGRPSVSALSARVPGSRLARLRTWAR
jgi:hypothetical protein